MVMAPPMVPCLTRKVMTCGGASALPPGEGIVRVLPLILPAPDWPTTSADASSEDTYHVVRYWETNHCDWVVRCVSVRVKTLPGAICPPYRDGEVVTDTDPLPNRQPMGFFQ